MKRLKFIIVTMSILFAINVSGQVRDVEKIEFEISGGAVFPMYDSEEAVFGDMGFQLGGELRYNVKPTLDIGFRYSFSIFHRSPFDVSHQINTGAFLATIDYNWRAADELNFFIGGGMGLNCPLDKWQRHGDIETGGYGHDRYFHPVLAPRLGVELFNQLRLTSEYRLTATRFSYFAFTVGYVFGGRPK